jgi:hypothetical protein
LTLTTLNIEKHLKRHDIKRYKYGAQEEIDMLLMAINSDDGEDIEDAEGRKAKAEERTVDRFLSCSIIKYKENF